MVHILGLAGSKSGTQLSLQRTGVEEVGVCPGRMQPRSQKLQGANLLLEVDGAGEVLVPPSMGLQPAPLGATTCGGVGSLRRGMCPTFRGGGPLAPAGKAACVLPFPPPDCGRDNGGREYRGGSASTS